MRRSRDCRRDWRREFKLVFCNVVQARLKKVTLFEEQQRKLEEERWKRKVMTGLRL